MKDLVKFEARTEQYLVQYDKAVTALQAAKEALSLDGLQVVDITIEALRARGKIAQDERAKQRARELEIEKYRTAAIIAQAIVDRDKPITEWTSPRGKNMRRNIGAQGVLKRAGWPMIKASAAIRIGRATEPQLAALKKSKAQLTQGYKIIPKLSAVGRKRKSDAWNSLTTYEGIGLLLPSTKMQKTSAKNLAEEFEDRDEIILARRSVKQVRDWCDEFLKHLPKARA